MKLKYQFETVELDGEIMAVPVGDGSEALHAVLRLNETAADILRLLKEDTTEQTVVDEMLKLYKADPAELTAHVREFIQKLDNAGAIER